jgi:hypothetical protein
MCVRVDELMQFSVICTDFSTQAPVYRRHFDVKQMKMDERVVRGLQ